MSKDTQNTYKKYEVSFSTHPTPIEQPSGYKFLPNSCGLTQLIDTNLSVFSGDIMKRG